MIKDKLKEELNNLRVFLTVKIAVIIATTSGIISRIDKIHHLDKISIIGIVIDFSLMVYIIIIFSKIQKNTEKIGEI